MDHRSTELLRRVLSVALPGGALMAGFSSVANASTQPAEIPSALVITKSSNRNQVNYAVQVDEACMPSGRDPVHPYWRMLERSANATEPLVDAELRAFGVQRQNIDADGINVVLRGMPSRSITIRTWRGTDGKCTSSAKMTIAGVAARVTHVFVRQKLFGVDYVEVTGSTPSGELVRERLSL
jgi:hypothetical protein